jgi:hypothetical protein
MVGVLYGMKQVLEGIFFSSSGIQKSEAHHLIIRTIGKLHENSSTAPAVICE